MGKERTVCTAGTSEHFQAAGGCGQPDRREKTVSRFQKVWSQEDSDRSWTSCGPEGEQQPEALERNAALFLLGKGPQGGNLLAATGGSERLTQAMNSRRRRLWTVFIAIGLLCCAAPWWIRVQLMSAQQEVREEMEREYQAITGTVSPAPGQEVLLARRYLEDQRGAWLQAREEVSGPHLTERFLRVTFALSSLRIPLVRVEADTKTLTALVLATQEQVETLNREIRSFGDVVESSQVDDRVWKVEVREP
jgi:hypothetical protein